MAASEPHLERSPSRICSCNASLGLILQGSLGTLLLQGDIRQVFPNAYPPCPASESRNAFWVSSTSFVTSAAPTLERHRNLLRALPGSAWSQCYCLRPRQANCSSQHTSVVEVHCVLTSGCVGSQLGLLSRQGFRQHRLTSLTKGSRDLSPEIWQLANADWIHEASGAMASGASYEACRRTFMSRLTHQVYS